MSDRPAEPTSASPLIVPRLWVMMALQYAALGFWAVTVGTYFARNTGDAGRGIFGPGFIGLFATTGAIAALTSPMLLGVLADRYFSIEKLLAALHIICGGCLWVMCESDHQTLFYVMALVYFHAYAPSSTLSSTLALRHLPDPEKQFPMARGMGTVGWVGAGVMVGLGWPWVSGVSIEGTLTPLWIAIGCHLLVAAYCLTLPATPPLGQANVGLRSLMGGASLWRNRPFLIFLAISAAITAPAQFYNSFANPFLNDYGFHYAAAKLSVGQIVEVLCMMALPLLLPWLGLKRLFLIGALLWAARFVLLALCEGGSLWFAYPAILVHGPSYVFVHLTGQLYADRAAARDARAAAQGLHALATLGVGQLLGALAARWAQATYLTPLSVSPPPYDWKTFWLIPAGMSLVTAVLFALLFHERGEANPRTSDVTE